MPGTGSSAMRIRRSTSGWTHRIFIVLLGFGLAGGLAAFFKAAEPAGLHQEIPLWPQGAPGAKGTDPKLDVPTLTAWLPGPDVATGAAVVVCPGGGYGMLAVDHEGTQVAQWLNSLGVAAFV